MRREDAMKVTCPKCGAPPSLPCMGKKRARIACHIERHPNAWDGRKGPSKDVRSLRCNKPGRIYFIRAEETGFIKIGWTGTTVARRLKQLQTACPHRLLIMAEMPGDQRKEQSLHAAFKAHQVQGEWFRDEGKLSDLIDCLLMGGGL